MPTRLIFLLLSLLFPLHYARAPQTITIDLELQHPKPAAPNSPRGFPSTVHLFTPPKSYIPNVVTRALRLRTPEFASHAVAIDLLGGITKVGEYYTRISIGGQAVRVQVDTGSSTLALPVAECDRCLPSDQRYNPRKSHTGKARWISCVNKLCAPDMCAVHQCGKCSSHDACCAEENPKVCGFRLKYGDGSLARGGLMVDVMSWGNVSAPVIFGGILHDSIDFERPIVDGILGMSYKALACNPTCVEPPFQQMVKAGVVEDSFSICITPQGGKLVLGKFDPSVAKTNLTYVPLALSDPPTFYTMNVSNHITIGGRPVGVPDLQAGILDSGTTLVVVSKTTFIIMLKQLIKYHCDVPGLCHTDAPWFMPAACVKLDPADVEKLPTFTFHLGPNREFDLELRPQDYMLPVNKPGKEGYRCVGFMAVDDMGGGTDIIFGNTVMTRYASFYDRKNKRLGFAEAAEGCGGASRCSSYTQCGECASVRSCSYNFQEERCQQKTNGLGLVPYPICSGKNCFCSLGRQAGLTFGLIDGFVGTLLILLVGLFIVALYSRRRGSDAADMGRGGDLDPIYTVTDDEDYEEGGEEGRDGRRPGKEYLPVPAE